MFAELQHCAPNGITLPKLPTAFLLLLNQQRFTLAEQNGRITYGSCCAWLWGQRWSGPLYSVCDYSPACGCNRENQKHTHTHTHTLQKGTGRDLPLEHLKIVLHGMAGCHEERCTCQPRQVVPSALSINIYIDSKAAKGATVRPWLRSSQRLPANSPIWFATHPKAIRFYSPSFFLRETAIRNISMPTEEGGRGRRRQKHLF